MALLTLGINYKTAPVEIRERVSFTPETIEAALTAIQSDCNLDEIVIVSTCNRTELYLSAQSENTRMQLLHWLADYHRLTAEELEEYVYCYDEAETVSHVLHVASGIDSMILGEPQILGQIKDAYRCASQAGTVGTLLSKLFQFTFTVAKQVRTDTAIGSSPVSVAFTAVNLAKQIFGALDPYTVLLIGAGETIELTARHLYEQKIGRVIVANRTIQRAHTLASQFNGYAIALNEIPAHLEEADIVISSTASREPILRRETVEQCLKQRKHRPIFMVDLAVPRDIEAGAGELNDIYLYTIDDLHNVVNENLESRKDAADQAREIIEVQVNQFLGWKKSLEAVETIRALRGLAEDQRDETLAKARQLLKKGRPADEVLRFLAYTLTNKIMHLPSTSLKQAGAQGRSELIKAAQELFELHERNADKTTNQTQQ